MGAVNFASITKRVTICNGALFTTSNNWFDII